VRAGGELAQHVLAAPVGQVEVEHDQPRVHGARRAQALAGVAGLEHVPGRGVAQLADGVARRRVVVDYQDARARQAVEHVEQRAALDRLGQVDVGAERVALARVVDVARDDDRQRSGGRGAFQLAEPAPGGLGAEYHVEHDRRGTRARQRVLRLVQAARLHH